MNSEFFINKKNSNKKQNVLAKDRAVSDDIHALNKTVSINCFRK